MFSDCEDYIHANFPISTLHNFITHYKRVMKGSKAFNGVISAFFLISNLFKDFSDAEKHSREPSSYSSNVRWSKEDEFDFKFLMCKLTQNDEVSA